MGQVTIQLPTISSDSKVGFSEDISYWLNLWDNYINEFQNVVIHCWNEETEAIEELNQITDISVKEGLITSFTLSLTEDTRTFLREHSADANGGLKWFTLFFQIDNENRLVIGHYGSEIVFFFVNKEHAEKFMSLFPETVSSQFYDDYIE